MVSSGHHVTTHNRLHPQQKHQNSHLNKVSELNLDSLFLGLELGVMLYIFIFESFFPFLFSFLSFVFFSYGFLSPFPFYLGFWKISPASMAYGLFFSSAIGLAKFSWMMKALLLYSTFHAPLEWQG